MWSALSRTARTLGTCFAVEIRDLWPESLQQLAGLPSWHPFVLACRRSDRIGLRRAAAVLSPLERVGEAIRARGFPNLPCIHIPNGVSIDVEPLPPLDGRLGQLVSESREEGRCIALYAGAIGVPNALDQFIEALEIMPSQERNSWRVLIVGEGSERERLARRVRLKTLPVAFIGSQPQQQVRALCRACDVGLIGWLDRPLYRFGIAPQKRSLMLGEGLPVLHAVPHGIINESALGTGWSVDAGDARGIAGAMKSARETTPWHRKNMRSACLRLARKTLDWDVIATESLEQLREIIVNHRRGR
jgi:glycosyltransferase involved in cell wall biosynthesis